MVFCCLFAHGTQNSELTLFPTMWMRVCVHVSAIPENVCASECVRVYRARTQIHIERCSWKFVVLSLCVPCTQGVFHANLLSTFSSVKCRMAHRTYVRRLAPHTLSNVAKSNNWDFTVNTHTHQHLFIHPHFCAAAAAVVLVGNRSKQCNLIPFLKAKPYTIRACMCVCVSYVYMIAYVFACVLAIWKAKSWKNRYLDSLHTST